MDDFVGLRSSAWTRAGVTEGHEIWPVLDYESARDNGKKNGCFELRVEVFNALWDVLKLVETSKMAASDGRR